MWNPIQRLIRKGLSPFLGRTTIGSRHLAGRSRRTFAVGCPESLENRQLMAADLVLANTPPRYELRETTQVSVQLTSPSREATVTAYALAPQLSGNATREMGDSVVLFDDGKHGDGQADDGIYGNRVPLVSRSGSHHIVVKANGVTETDEAFQLETSYDIDVTAAASLIVDSDSDLFAVGRRDGYMQHLARLPTVMWDIASDPFSEWLYVIEH
ncbi:MAG: hypothetical protein KDB23_32790, partial [Planctomycetales bacterium]|nr:hypothetical protein [Planctomycetales bacterium]